MNKLNIKRKRVLYPLLFIILGAIIVFNVIRISSASGPEKVVAYQVENGWGYRILRNNMAVVDQPFIPLLPGKTPFPSRRKAMKTGKLVLSRLQRHQIPVITLKDLEELGVLMNK
jgi:hypothetical protein